MNDAHTTSMEKIVQAVAIDDFKIVVLTSSGLSGVFDVKPYLKGSAFKALRSEKLFQTSQADALRHCVAGRD